MVMPEQKTGPAISSGYDLAILVRKRRWAVTLLLNPP
jgi:hypothetical protein